MTSVERRARLPVETQAKTALCRASLLALATAFELASERVPELKAEMTTWRDGLRVTIGVLPAGPCMHIEKRGDRIRYLGSRPVRSDVSILFKNLDSALLVFTARIGAHRAVAENRVIVYGSTHEALSVTRAMAVVQTYLFPGAFLKRTFKRPPKLTPAQMARKALILGLLVPALSRTALR
ncbi:MAG: hypothetical protein AB1640_01300 [bacterium]